MLQNNNHTSPSILRRNKNVTLPTNYSSPNTKNNRFNPSTPPPKITTPPQPNNNINKNNTSSNNQNNNLLLETAKINNSNIVVKRKRNSRHSKTFDTVTTPSPTRYVYQQPAFTSFYPLPVSPIPPLPLGIKGVYSHPYTTQNYFPPHPSYTPQLYPRYNAQPIQQHLEQNPTTSEVLAEGDCIAEEDNISTSDINISTERPSSESSGQKRRSIVTKLRQLVNKTDEYLTKSKLKEIANREKEEMDEISAYYKDESPKPVPVTGLPPNRGKKEVLDLEFSQLVSITRSAFSHLAKEYSKIGIDIPTNRFVKPEKTTEDTVPNLLSDTSYFFCLVESLIGKKTNISQQDQPNATLLNVLKTMESVLLDDTDKSIILSQPSTSVYQITDDYEEFYEEIMPKYLFMNNSRETDLFNTSINTIAKNSFAQQVEVNNSSITIQTDEVSMEEVSLQTSPLESSSIDIQTEQQVIPRTTTDVQTEPVSFSLPEKQIITISTQTDNVERISVSTMTDELPVQQSTTAIEDKKTEIQSTKTGTKRKKVESSSSSSSEENEEEEEIKPRRRKLRKQTITKTSISKKQAEPVYYIQEVVKHDNTDGKNWFYVKWQGFSARYNSWVEEHDILDKTLIKKYLKK